MPRSDLIPAARGIPLWIIVGVAVLAGGVGSAAVLSANQFLAEARTGAGPNVPVIKPVVAATVLPGPDRFMPKGLIQPSPAPVAVLAANDPRFGAPAPTKTEAPFDLVDKSGGPEAEEEEPITLAALAEKPAKPTKAVKAADEKPKAAKAKASGPITGRSVTNDDVNIRSGASSKSAVIGTIPANTSVDIVKCASWCEIAYDGKRGYVYSGFLGKGAKAKTAAPALAAAKPSDAKVKSAVTLEPKKKWSLFRKKSESETAQEPVPAFN